LFYQTADIWGKELALLRSANTLVTRRIVRDFKNFQMESPKGCKVGFAEDIFHWEAIMIGPQDSPYADGVFLLNIDFSVGYPFKPPIVNFKTKVILTAFPLLNFDYLAMKLVMLGRKN
jgi:ubiquitin-protein ligase